VFKQFCISILLLLFQFGVVWVLDKWVVAFEGAVIVWVQSPKYPNIMEEK